jgi:hypothetical protein
MPQIAMIQIGLLTLTALLGHFARQMLMGATFEAHIVVTRGAHNVITSGVFLQGGSTMRTRFRIGELQGCRHTVVATIDT